jgi:hypothetical protein
MLSKEARGCQSVSYLALRRAQARGDVAMYAIEFQAKIENGTIQVPGEYHQHLQEQGAESPVRVIILLRGQEPGIDFIDELLANPIRVSDFAPLARNELHERN